MTYDEAIAWWFARVNYERLSPDPVDLKLDRMRELLHRLGDPHQQFRSVHVAGSKGKGSTCAMIESILRHAGYRTGLFTSPHLSDVRERIQVDAEVIERQELVEVAAVVRPAVEAMEASGQPPTFFEVSTALGFVHFARQKVAVAVVEVGLGGRFDSTNVITPLVSAITSISLDHTAILGESTESIAFEKAGIIKPGVPVISGVLEPGPREVIERIAKERSAPLIQCGRDYRVVATPGQVSPTGEIRSGRVAIWWERHAAPTFPLPLLGSHQGANAGVALAVIEWLRPFGLQISEEARSLGLEAVRWPARLEVLRTRPLGVLDCAHNVASAEALAAALRDVFPPMPRTMIFAASNDKNVAGMFHILAPLCDRFELTRTESSRAIAPEQLAAALPAGTRYELCPKPLDAWRTACDLTAPDGLIVIAGSVFLAGELRPQLLSEVQVVTIPCVGSFVAGSNGDIPDASIGRRTVPSSEE